MRHSRRVTRFSRASPIYEGPAKKNRTHCLADIAGAKEQHGIGISSCRCEDPDSVRSACGWHCFLSRKSGLWRGNEPGSDMPIFFSRSSSHIHRAYFDSARAFACSVQRQGEANGSFWKRPAMICSYANLDLKKCFFTNSLMGLTAREGAGQNAFNTGLSKPVRCIASETN